MSDILKFACKAPNCGRRFTNQEVLNTHLKCRHPELINNKEIKPKIENEIEKKKEKVENIIKKISNTKLNPHEKHHNILQPIEHKISSSMLTNKRKSQVISGNKKMHNSNNNSELPINNVKENNIINKEKNIIKNNKENFEEIKIPNILEEKQKKLLNNLFGQINSLENYLEKDCEFHKTFYVPEIPNYDKMYDSDDESEKNNNIIIKDNKDNENEKIREITNEMIFNNKYDKIDDIKYKEIHELNLSKKNITNFKNHKKVSFEKLSELFVLNLSYNELYEINDIISLENLKELDISNNKIEDISFCENLPNLTNFNAENNNIITITSLNICSKMKILKISNNKIKYLNSTLRTIKNLLNLEELSIKGNPFLSELFSYREYFITFYSKISTLDNEKIDEEKRIFSENFYKENNPLYKNNIKRPLSSKHGINENKNKINSNDIFEVDDEQEDINKDNYVNSNMFKTQINFGENFINYKNNGNIESEKEDYNKKINDDELEEEIRLKEIINEQNEIIKNLKLELEKSSKINEQNENEIEKYKLELEVYEKSLNNKNINKNELIVEDEENNKIIKGLEMWKREYFKLLEKEMNDKNKFSEDLFNIKTKAIEENINIMGKKKERPQTANVNSELSKNFEKLYEEINVLKNRNNIVEEMLDNKEDEENGEENTNEEEENEKEEIEKLEEIKEKNEIKNDFVELDENEEDIPDDEIEEMFRKSCQDIQKMKKDIKEMNEIINKRSNKNSNENDVINLNNKEIGNKPLILKPPLLKPVAVKNDNNSNIFGKLSGINKIKNENNKNPSQRYQNTLLHLK